MTSRVIRCGNCGISGHNKRTCKVVVRRKSKRLRKPTISLKRIVKCGSCGDTGHNKKTCVKRILKQPEYKSCAICMDDCKEKTCTLECGHMFHTKCIFTWFKKNNNCPMCRAEVPEMKQTVETPSINLPSPAFMGAIMRMVDESLMTENAPIRLEDMNPQRYLEAVMVFTNLTLNNMSSERRAELIRMEGTTGGW